MTSRRRSHCGRIGLILCGLAAVMPATGFGAPSAAREWNEQILAAIRINVPNPPGHARNLFHVAVAMYDAWAAYDPTAVGYIYNEKVSPLPADVEAARRESISYAAYRVITNRFVTPTPKPAGADETEAKINDQLTAMGYDVGIALLPTNNTANPAELGKRVGQAIITWGSIDGWSNSNYPQPYDAAHNPNMALAINVLGQNLTFAPNMPLGFGIPSATNPNKWQPLALASQVTQNGIPIPGGVQVFVGVQGLTTTPFSLTRTDPLKPWIDPFGGPSQISVPGQPSATDAAYKEQAMGVLRFSAQLNDDTVKNFSPAAIGNNPLGADTGTGYATNPVSGQSYAVNEGKVGDFHRVIAEFWADGPKSETPPGHWHVLANEIADDPELVKKVRGVGPVLNDLEWDVKTYFAVASATHDAACACWALKRYYSGPRPITMIRYMASLGQSSDPLLPSYHPQGLPLEPGVSELVTAATAAPGGRHETIWDVAWGEGRPGSLYIDQVVVFSWPGEHPDNLPAPSIATHQSMVRWQLGKDWLPFQRKTFNTPAFPGYVSGHSTFSRSAAEVLTLMTGSPYFPGGFHHHTFTANSMQIDLGPSADVDLQWASYYDAADQAGQSRRWGGIHPSEDDYHGRYIGSQVGKSAFALAEKYWNGTINEEVIIPKVTIQQDATVKLEFRPVRGMYHKIQSSTDLVQWKNIGSYKLSYVNGSLASDTVGTYTDLAPAPGQNFYRVLRSTSNQ